MNGYKTYASALALALMGVFEIYSGDSASGAQKIIGALALVGIGHKLDKVAAPKVTETTVETVNVSGDQTGV